MNRFTFLCVFVMFTHLLVAQNEPFFKSYDWDENPVYNINDNNNEDIIAVKEKILTEFYFQGDEGLVEYFLEHRILWLNSDESIEDYNKVYLPYSSSSNLEVNKGRVITKDGNVIELDDSKILTAQNDETGKEYKFFAFEGIEKGSFIEYYYVVKRLPQYKGNRINVQSYYSKKNVEFDVYAPKNLIFKFKSYNGIPFVNKDSLSTLKLHWQMKTNNVKSIEDEDTSAYQASKGYIIYKLDSNTANEKKEISSYGKVAQNIYSYYYPEYDKRTKTLINEFIAEVDLNSDEIEENTIRQLESFIKTNVYISEANSDDLKDLDEVLDKKISNETGVIKLYTALFSELNIKHEIVITCDRQKMKFDKNFEANNFLTDFLIYFPRTKSYLSPTEIDSRYGFPPAYLTDNYGLFIKEVKIGDYKSGVGKIKYIKAVIANETVDKMVIDVEFEEGNLSNNLINLDRSFSGYYALDIQPFIHLVKEDDKTQFIESFAKNLNEEVEILDKKMLNGDPSLFGIKPLQIIVNFSSEAFIEKAGKRYLFKVGELIGRQMELYQEKERVLPVESEYNRSYFRTININIPKGYKIANLDDININNVYLKDNKELLSFKSFYKINDNVLKITADEHYRINIIETSEYNAYRTVINSAADFNKLTLILEPIVD